MLNSLVNNDISPRYGTVLFWMNGHRIDISYPALLSRNKGGGIRGDIEEFTAKSRKRLMLKIAEIDKDVYKECGTYFLTLTYHDNFQDAVAAKQHLENLYMRIRRANPCASMIWRIELQARGAIHFHCILILRERVDEWKLTKFVSRAWTDITGGDMLQYKWHMGMLGNEKCVSVIEDYKRVMRYVSKYVSKVDGNERKAKIGRRWGVMGNKWLRIAHKIRVLVTKKEVSSILRYAKRYIGVRNSLRVNTLKIMVNNTQRWFEVMDRLIPESNKSKDEDIGGREKIKKEVCNFSENY